MCSTVLVEGMCSYYCRTEVFSRASSLQNEDDFSRFRIITAELQFVDSCIEGYCSELTDITNKYNNLTILLWKYLVAAPGIEPGTLRV